MQEGSQASLLSPLESSQHGAGSRIWHSLLRVAVYIQAAAAAGAASWGPGLPLVLAHQLLVALLSCLCVWQVIGDCTGCGACSSIRTGGLGGWGVVGGCWLIGMWMVRRGGQAGWAGEVGE